MEFLSVIVHTLAAFSEMFDFVRFLRELLFFKTDAYSFTKKNDYKKCMGQYLIGDEKNPFETTSTSLENESETEVVRQSNGNGRIGNNGRSTTERLAQTEGFQGHLDGQNSISDPLTKDCDFEIPDPNEAIPSTELESLEERQKTPSITEAENGASIVQVNEESPLNPELGFQAPILANLDPKKEEEEFEQKIFSSEVTLENCVEPLTTSRFYTSSWDLVSIIKLLYKLRESSSESAEEEEECFPLVHYPLKCHLKVVVVDLGSCSVRAGILMDQPTLPSLFFPSVCATHKVTGEHMYGMEALSEGVRQNSVISFPLRPSVKITKHNIDVEKVAGIFQKIFHELRVEPSEYKVQVCLPRSLSNGAQNDLVEVLLEGLGVQAVSLAHQAIFTMYAHDASTGIVVDIGDRMDILLIIDGFVVESGVTRLPHGGQRLIHHMKHALAQKQISLSNDMDSFVVQYIAENTCFVASNYEKEQRLAMSHPELVRKSIDLHLLVKDDHCMQCATLDEARFTVPEGLFDPDLWGLDSPGVHKLVQKAIQAAGVDSRKQVAQNIFVSGGVTLIPGFVDRLREEVTRLNEPRITPKVYASNHRYHCTFMGACKFSRMDAFQRVCVTREEFSKNRATALKKFVLCI